ncbi:unnamed protein product [Cunninghamella blakesleeana]
MDFSPYKPSPDNHRAKQEKQKANKGKTKTTIRSQDNNISNNNNNTYSPYQTGGSNGSSSPNHPSSSTAAYYKASTSSSLLEEGFYDANIHSTSGNGTAVRVNKYETTLPIRVDIEAVLAYVAPPLSGLLLLVLETQNDYVRFHAWQSSLYFLALMILQFILLFISNFLSWLLFLFGIGSILFLCYRAYLDGASLERFELPYFGSIASDYVDTE